MPSPSPEFAPTRPRKISAKPSNTRHPATGRTLRIRNKFLVFMVGVVIALVGFGVGTQGAQSTPGAQEVISYTVRPGDSIWSYAASITPPGEDVSPNIDRIMEINNLSSPRLQAGDRILVPKD